MEQTAFYQGLSPEIFSPSFLYNFSKILYFHLASPRLSLWPSRTSCPSPCNLHVKSWKELEEKQFFIAAVGSGVGRNRGRGAALLGQKDARLADWSWAELSRMAKTSANDVSNNTVVSPQTAWVVLVRQFFEASTEKMQNLFYFKYHQILFAIQGSVV